MDRPDGNEWLSQLKSQVRHLAADAETQVDYLTRLGTSSSADELALEFDDLFASIKLNPAESGLGQPSVDALRRLDDYLDSFSGPDRPELWTFDALRTSSQWARVRELATDALQTLDIDDER